VAAVLAGLPLQVAQLDRDWLVAVLGPVFGAEPPCTVAAEAVLNGTATKVRLRLDGTGPGWPASVIVKGGFAAHRELMAPIYAKEVQAYRDILPQVGIEVPTCWLAADDAEHHQHLLVLEDLEQRGVRFCRVQQPLSFDQAAAFLDALARLHARWWADAAAFSPGGAFASLPRWQPLPALPEGAYHWGQIEPAVWQSFTRLPRGVAVPKALHDRERMLAALLALQDFNAHGEDCLIHGDAHLGNLYLTAQGEAGILDWQSFVRGPWHHDVGYFIVSSLDVPDRRRWEQALLAHYLDRLQAHGVQQAPSFDEAFDAYRRQPVNGLYFWMVNPIEFQEELNNCAVAPRFAMAALDLDSFALLGV
jgi:aminoglycoside/choline kinase family phosphotransferase